MGKKTEMAEIASALEDITRALQQTNELLKALGQLGTDSPKAREQPDPGDVTATVAGPNLEIAEEATLAPRATAASTGDEEILRTLAEQHGLGIPMEQLIAFRNTERPNSRPRYWAIANFALHSRNPRLFLFDVVEDEVGRYLCAHGSGSDEDHNGMLDRFSNVDGSGCSSRGIYVCAETYMGDNGYSMRLDGQEDTNNRARHRAIVVHGANYVSPEFVEQHGKIGRSLGCPALEHRYTRDVIDALKQGSLLNVWKA